MKLNQLFVSLTINKDARSFKGHLKVVREWIIVMLVAWVYD